MITFVGVRAGCNPAPRTLLRPPRARVTVRFVKKSQHVHCKTLSANELLNERHVQMIIEYQTLVSFGCEFRANGLNLCLN